MALIALLAQMGSFVPAARAEIGVVDRIFTRVGASDNLAGGESTFMVEMKETAQHPRPAHRRAAWWCSTRSAAAPAPSTASRSPGRSPSTCTTRAARPLVLFATHYHELTDLARSKARVRNCSVAVREWKGEVVFLRRIVPGPASQSYGIQVARLAGVPAADHRARARRSCTTSKRTS